MSAKPPKYRLGIDLGGTKIHAVVIDRKGRVLGSAKTATKPDKGYQRVVERIAEIADDALDDADVRGKDVKIVGIGAPGPVDAKRGLVLFSPNLGWKNKPLAEDLGAELGLETILGNDVNFGALGEVSYGAARGIDNAFAAFVGTGLGGAVVINGEVVNGMHGFGGEFGHVPSPFGDARCGCGKRGCLETVASKVGVMRQIHAAKRNTNRRSAKPVPVMKSSQIMDALAKGDAVVEAAIDQLVEGLAWGLSTVGNLLDPEVFILGGGLAEALGQHLPIRVARQMASTCVLYAKYRPNIVMAELGDDAVAIGAAVAAGRER